MGFFRKLFRRKTTSEPSPALAVEKSSCAPKLRGRGRTKATPGETKDYRVSPTNTDNEEPVLSSNDDKLNAINRRGPDLSDGSQPYVIKQRAGRTSLSPPSMEYRGGPVDLDQEQSDVELSAPEQDENAVKKNHPRLSTQRLHEFTQQQQHLQKTSPASSPQVFSMAMEPPRPASPRGILPCPLKNRMARAVLLT